MGRGNRGAGVFKTDADRGLFLETLAEAVERTGWVVQAWVLMKTHYHLLLETPEANLVVGMNWFPGTFTQRYNSRHKEWGHLFQGRYKEARQGPYYEWTRREKGRYVHTVISAEQAEKLVAAIDNNRRVLELLRRWSAETARALKIASSRK